MKKLLIVTSMRTGGGHVSLTEALTEQLAEKENVQFRVMDGFDLMSRPAQWLLADSYGWITRRKWLLWFWKLGYAVVEKRPVLSEKVFTRVCRKRFLALVREFQPDAVVANNCCFIGGLMNIMEQAGIAVPLFSMQADLIDISAAWFDRRTTLNIALTEEAYAVGLEKGMAVERMAMGGFPVRRRFYADAPAAVCRTAQGYPQRILVMGGAEGAGNFVAAAEKLLQETDSIVTVVCARNRKLKARLEKTLLPRYGARIRPLGFVDNMKEEMDAADLIVMRGSPNSAMEAAAMQKPLIILDALPGQEANNPRVLADHGLCRLEPSIDRLPETLRSMFDESSGAISEMQRAQRAYMDPGCAGKIADMILRQI